MDDDSRHADSDRELARYLGGLLDEGLLDDRAPNAGALSEDDAALVRAALLLRGREAPSEGASARMWRRIEEAIDTPKVRRRPAPRVAHESDRRVVLHRLRPRTWMAVAAAIIVGAVATLLILQRPEPVLVASAEDAAVEYLGADGSTVLLRPHSELYLVDSSDEIVRYRLYGEAFFSVTPRVEQVFAVQAGEAVVEVLGTRFNLSTWGDAAAVFLEEGRIRFAHEPSGTDVILEPGQWSRITEAGAPVPPNEEPPDEHVDWIDGEIRFDQERAALVAAEIEHHFDVELALPGSLAGETLSGRILLDDRQQSLEDLGQVLGGRFVEAGERTYRFESE